MKMTQISLEDAVGRPLAHDLTKIDASAGTKGARFKKGQIITEADLPVLRDMGREHLSILEFDEGETHEDDAAGFLCGALCGENCVASPPEEGRITLRAGCDGFLCYESGMVHRVNEDPDWALATMAPHRSVRAGQPVAGFRILPLSMTRDRVDRALAAAGRIDVKPFLPLRAGLVTTGHEIASGKISDAFRGKFEGKLASFGGQLIGQRFVTDDPELIAEAIRGFISEGADVVVCTGGMSVDADDRTPGGIGLVAKRAAFRGVPALPGAMLMLSWADSPRGGRDVAVIGAPACVVHDERTALDRALPFIFAGMDPAPYVRSWGVGGLCEHCSPCHWPECAYSSGF
ncbi:MAG: molybdopterin-binding protein [Synergistaceae bacterium]|jgi:molybdopterin biosynthesis enzyme MoaB|nr:molybdopterin-binding protein [Synergistaceae bacterium]